MNLELWECPRCGTISNQPGGALFCKTHHFPRPVPFTAECAALPSNADAESRNEAGS